MPVHITLSAGRFLIGLAVFVAFGACARAPVKVTRVNDAVHQRKGELAGDAKLYGLIATAAARPNSPAGSAALGEVIEQ